MNADRNDAFHLEMIKQHDLELPRFSQRGEIGLARRMQRFDERAP